MILNSLINIFLSFKVNLIPINSIGNKLINCPMQSSLKYRKNKSCVYFVVLFIGQLKRRIKKTKHRRYVLDEWLTTQQNFKKDLIAAVEYIKKPMVAQELIDKDGINILFPQFEGMLQLSDLMIQTVGIIRKQKNPNFILIGDKLIYFATFYKLYGTYFGNRLRSQQLLKKLSENHPEEMKKIEDNLKSYMKTIDLRKENMGISDCLQQPQYRMFKYVLLMKDYLKKLPKTHKDYAAFAKALGSFEQINLSNNQLMVKLQAQQKKIKLDRLFGKSIGNTSEYIVQMSAQTLYFPVKLYIFNNLVIIAAISDTLGFIEERRYLNLQLNEFSFIHAKPDGKYYKNVLLLSGRYQAIHLFLPDLGERQEILISIGKVIKELQCKAINLRKQKAVSNENTTNKLSFAIQTTKNLVFASEVRIQVLKVQVRPFSTFSNDTAYLTKFMGPVYLQDDQISGNENENLGEASGVNGIWQMVQIHLSKVMQLLKELREEYPMIQFPEIDPLTKQINAFTEGKKNTKTYEVRAYLFEEFFNFLFRHPTITMQPFKWISKYKIVSPFIQYLFKKNDYFSRREETKDTNYKFGNNHCQICKQFSEFTLDQIQKYRRQYSLKAKKDECFNAFNLLRIRVCKMLIKSFDNLQKILLRQYYQSGRLDYSLMPHQQLHKKYQVVKIMYCNSARNIDITSDYRKKVGQILIDLGSSLGLDTILDYRLILNTDSHDRILDQDEIFFDLLKKFEIQARQEEDSNKVARQTYNQTSLKEQQGFFSFIISSLSFNSKSSNYISLKKIIFLTKEIQIKSFERNPKKALLTIQELFGRLLLGQIPLQFEDWGEISALWLIINYNDKIEGNNPVQSLKIVYKKIMPLDKKDMLNNKVFMKVYLETYNQYATKIKNKLSQKQYIQLFKRSLRVFYRSAKTYTYIIPVVPHTVPLEFVSDGLGPILNECYLGVNYKELLVFRGKQSPLPAVKLGLQDLRVTTTTFSIFIEQSYFLSNPSHSGLKSGELSNNNFRFDSRVLFHFDSILKIYMNLKKAFPHLLS